MNVRNAFMQRIGLSHPIIQAPLAGGGDTPALVAAVSNAGGLGFIGAAYLLPEQVRAVAADVRARTSQPFGINLFAPQLPSQRRGNPETMLARVAPYFAELNLPAPELPKPAANTFDEQLAACLESGAAVFSFTFGEIPSNAVRSIKARNILLIGTATTVNEAVALEKSGVDAIVAQGSEAGGHRGTFSGDFAAGMIGGISLVPQVIDAVGVPVIASGGIMDGRGIVAALALGASAVQMGTAFLTCDESGIPDAYRKAILRAEENQTRITRAFSGRPARGIENRFMKEVELGPDDDAILPFPIQNGLTRALRTAASKLGRAEFLSLWAGQGVRLARRQSAAELIARLAKETDAVISALKR
jgi:nitronate monooxygenase